MSPSYCDNYLMFPKGDASLLIKFFSTGSIHESVFLDFDKIIPCPKQVKEVANRIPLMGRDWSLANWGTIQNSFSGSLNSNHLNFMTLGSRPPIPVIAELSKIIDTPLRMIYNESTSPFCGMILVEPDGKLFDMYCLNARKFKKDKQYSLFT